MKNILYILSFAVLTIFMVGCDAESPSQDAEPIIGTDRYPTPSFTLSGGELTTNERNETVIVYDVVLDKPTDKAIDFSWVVVGGTATEHDDYDLVNGRVAAYQTTTQLMVMIYNDAIVEGTETLNLTIQSGPSLANQYLVNPNTSFPTINIQIEDYRFCLWTLETSDTYGDGWQGAVIELVSEGVTTQYSEGGETSTVEIPITLGADYSFTYISGGGTGGAPGYENENYYKLTAPDGTVFEDGTMDYSGVPTAGLITSGTSNCN